MYLDEKKQNNKKIWTNFKMFNKIFKRISANFDDAILTIH